MMTELLILIIAISIFMFAIVGQTRSYQKEKLEIDSRNSKISARREAHKDGWSRLIFVLNILRGTSHRNRYESEYMSLRAGISIPETSISNTLMSIQGVNRKLVKVILRNYPTLSSITMTSDNDFASSLGINKNLAIIIKNTIADLYQCSNNITNRELPYSI